ncbi:MAG: PGPGW domain-containing protein [Frankia sp.]|nr:PGPGW domain-containing protein [Frankia sp.]
MLRSTARLIRRILLTTLGLLVLGLGLAGLVLPGPGFLIIALGFFILSLEYEWARRRFEAARQKAADLADLAVARVWSTAGSILAGLAMIAAGILWIRYEELPFSSPWSGGSVIFGGTVVLVTIFVSLWQAYQARKAGRPTPAELLEAQRHTHGDDDHGHHGNHEHHAHHEHGHGLDRGDAADATTRAVR